MSEVKTIKVAEVAFNREYKPEGKQFIIYYFNMKTDDEMVGEFSTNGRNQTKFLVGESYSVEITEKSNRGGTYNWFDYSEAEKEKRKSSSGGSSKPQGKGGWQPYTRPRSEVVSIIAQSSYEAAVLACTEIGPDIIKSTDELKLIAKTFSMFIVKESGLSSTECMNGIKDALSAANNKSIVLQKALKLAVQSLQLNKIKQLLGTPDRLKSTQGLITLAEAITKDINEIANGL